jgi:hypothetical protein
VFFVSSLSLTRTQDSKPSGNQQQSTAATPQPSETISSIDQTRSPNEHSASTDSKIEQN